MAAAIVTVSPSAAAPRKARRRKRSECDMVSPLVPAESAGFQLI
jgi:hypothetical protein